MDTLIDVFLHLDTYLGNVLAQYGAWTYALLFLVIFAETGLVITPFLPGDSLLFAAGALAAPGDLNPWLIVLLLSAAAIVGDTVNYWIGRRIGKRVLSRGKLLGIRIRPEHIERTTAFYAKHGAKTIVLARFFPIIRTFAPFVAGVGSMRYAAFIAYNVVGGLIWVNLFTWGGYFFGNLPAVKEHFSLVIIAIVVVSFIPAVAELVRSRRRKGMETKTPAK
jgi:membrane-associated protein